MRLLARDLRNADGNPRLAVLVILWNDTTDVRSATSTTDKYGRFTINVTALPSGIYHLEYYGDGIMKTVFDDSGNKVQEDEVTPWEYGISIVSTEVAYDEIPPDNSIVQSAALET